MIGGVGLGMVLGLTFGRPSIDRRSLGRAVGVQVAAGPPDPSGRLAAAAFDPTSRAVADALADAYYRPVPAARLARLPLAAAIRSLEDPYTRYVPRRPAAPCSTAPPFRRALATSLRRGVPESRALAHASTTRLPSRLAESKGRPAFGRARTALVRGPSGSRSHSSGGNRSPSHCVGAAPNMAASSARDSFESAAAVSTAILATTDRRVGYLRLSEFRPGVGVEVKNAVRRFRRSRLDGLILDLRGNPGGEVVEANDVAASFLPLGSPISTMEGLHFPRTTFRTDRVGTDLSTPLVILVDRFSASASELLAGALRDNGRATIVGTRTFGKGVVQEVRPLPHGAAIELTVASYWTPSGAAVDHRGLAPDVWIAASRSSAHDGPLVRALQVATSPAAAPPDFSGRTGKRARTGDETLADETRATEKTTEPPERTKGPTERTTEPPENTKEPTS